MKSGIHCEDLNVDLILSFLKPIHAAWLFEMYDFFILLFSQGLVTYPCQVNRSCRSQNREIEATQNTKCLQNREINVSRKFHVMR